MPNISNMSAGNNASTIQTRNIIMTMLNKFRVIILKGRVTRFNIGLTKIRRRPVAAPTKRIVLKLPSKVTPSRR